MNRSLAFDRAVDLELFLPFPLEGKTEAELRTLAQGLSANELAQYRKDYIVFEYLVNKGEFNQMSANYPSGTSPSNFDLTAYSDAPSLEEEVVMINGRLTIKFCTWFYCITVVID